MANTEQTLAYLGERVVTKAKLNLRAGTNGFPPMVDTGMLLNSVEYRVEPDNNRVVIGTNLLYGAYLEFGTGKFAVDGNGRKTPWAWEGHSKRWKGWHYTHGMLPRPWLKPALDDVKEELSEAGMDWAKEMIANYIKQK